MIELTTQPAELRFVIEIVRAATGKTETVELVGHINPQQPKEPTHGCNS